MTTALNLPREVLRALRGHKAGPGKVLGHDGARPVWVDASGLVIVSPTEPTSPAVGQLWLNTDVTSLTNLMFTVDHATYNAALSPIVYDGDRAFANYVGMGFDEINPVIDLGVPSYIDHVNWLLYYGDTRTYADVGLEGSNNYSTWTTLRSPGTYQPSVDGSTGLDIPVLDTYRYLRFHCLGNSVNDNNEWVEVEVWGVSSYLLKLWDGSSWLTVSSVHA